MALALVIDANHVERMVAVLALRRAGHQVVEAGTCAQALELAATQRPDLVVCDPFGPAANACRFIRALREDRHFGDLPVMVLTAAADHARVRAVMNAGADDCLAKPFAAHELTDAAAALLMKKSAQRQAIVGAASTTSDAALAELKHQLAAEYEQRFARQLNAQWELQARSDRQLHYEHAVILALDIFGPTLHRVATGPELGVRVRGAFQRARDGLYLFGARHLVPHGDDMLAVFPDAPGAGGAPFQALRAAFALAKTLPPLFDEDDRGGGQRPVMAMSCGPVSLLDVSDPLHGEAHATLATGEAVRSVQSLLAFARSCGWRVTVPLPLAQQLRAGVVSGRRAVVRLDGRAAGEEVVELRQLRRGWGHDE